MLADEARLIVERVNRRHATEATLVQMAVSTILSKKAGKAFQKQIRELNEG